jgi:thioredoxin reductase (NADPH)
MMIVDDKPEDLAVLLDALARRFGSDYRVVSHLSGRAALENLEQLEATGEELALVIADQSLPEMTGLEFLQRVHETHPKAQRTLLVSWGDKTASQMILRGCAFGQLDNYLYKPWSPAEVHLYPAVGEYLADWTRAHGPRLEIVRVVGRHPSPRAHHLCDMLDRNGIPYGFHQVESEEGAELLRQAGLDDSQLPVVMLPDGHALRDPSGAVVCEALGVTDAEERSCDVAIVGAGPAGLAAAVYGASEGLSTIIIEREAVGGQAGTSSMIRNYLGFPRGISGGELTQRAYQQAWVFGTKFVIARRVNRLRANGTARILTLSNGVEITAQAVVIATGAAYRRLEIPSLDRFVGAGVFYATPSDTRILEGKDVVVVGGANSAGQAVLHLARSARRVTLVIRGDALDTDMSDYLVRAILRKSNIDIRLSTEVVDGAGQRALERVVLHDRNHDAAEELPTDALFVFIGVEPHTTWLSGSVGRDREGFVITGHDIDRAKAGWRLEREPLPLETSMPGVFAAGDVRLGSVKRVASAVGEGSAAVRYIHEYLAAPAALDAGDSLDTAASIAAST